MDAKLKPLALQRFYQATGTIMNPEVKRWQEQGGNVMGYFCSAMPQEMFTAADMLPFRIRATGSTSTELSDAFFSNINCSFARHAFNMALSGEYDFLYGLSMFNSCDNIRRIYDHWKRQLKTPFTNFICLPRKAGPAQVEFFRNELANLKQHIEEHLKVEMTDDKLREAIKLHNRKRSLLRQLYELRKADNPPISGADTLAVTVASTAMAPETFNDLLAELLEELEGAEGIKGHRARLMIIGGILDDPGYINVIEGQGGLVVTDSICFGSRNFWVDVDESNADPLMALAQYYVADRPSCPRTFGMHEKRAEFIKQMIDDFKVDGVIFERLTFCDVWGTERFPLSNDFVKWDVPLLTLDREYTTGAVGQLRTRAQAFIETLTR